MSEDRSGVSFVVPVHNGERWLDRVLAAILAQDDGRPIEILAVDDGSTDRSGEILTAYARSGKLRVLTGAGRGAAAAINLGVRHAVHPIVCQIDQDVILAPGWLHEITEALSREDVGAAQGYYRTPADAPVWARVMGLDLEQRYGRIRGEWIDQVCTGNAAYRAAALRCVNDFDESLGYGYDNDMSYRLGAVGYRLAFCRRAVSVHRWREGLLAYLVQQYGVGYGRLDVVARHRRRLAGDDVSGPGMILHALGMLVALAALAGAGVLAIVGGPAASAAQLGGVLVVALGVERGLAGIRAAHRFRDPAGLWFAPLHLARDVAWSLAIMAWTARRLLRRHPLPSHSMAR